MRNIRRSAAAGAPIGRTSRTFFDYPPDIRKVVSTTNAIESLNHSLRKIIKARGAFPDDEVVMKLRYLALQNVARRWTMPV